MENMTLQTLLIEDNLAQAGLIIGMLSDSRRQSFSVQHVQYLAEGLDLLRSRDFDVILVDLGLPDSRGLETVLAVRDKAKFTPIVVLTVLDDEDIALKALQMDIQDYLIKGEISGSLLQRSIRYAIQRKRDAEALRQSEHRFVAFMRNLPAAAWMKDSDGRYVYANAETERIFSIPFSEFAGKADDEFLPPETARKFRENDELVLSKGESLRTTEVLRQADGIEHHSIVSKFPVPGPDGEAAYVAGVGFDITERVRMEEALRFSETRFRALHNDNPAMIFTLDAEGRIISTNNAATSQLGYTAADMEDQPVLEIFHEEDRPAVTEQLRLCLQNPDQVYRWQFRKIRKDGGLMWVEELAQAIYDLNGELNVMVVCQDITERKRAEGEIKHLNTQLAARAVELEDANRDLEAFNYTVAHDLRKPLTTINGYCHIIQELCGDKLDKECAAYLQEAYDGTWRMNRLINTLLDFSRVSRIEPHHERVDLSDIARAVADELKHTEATRRATFRIAEDITVVGDAALLRVVLENLLGNAWKYTGIREESIIDFGRMEIDGQPAYFVRDNGPGFAMEDAAQLFIPFRRLPGTEKHAGFGIGLATVERIIRRHGGRVGAEGEPGKGATFWFTLS